MISLARVGSAVVVLLLTIMTSGCGDLSNIFCKAKLKSKSSQIGGAADVNGILFRSLDLINGAADGFINISEATADFAIAGNLNATGFDSALYSLAEADANCANQPKYGAMPVAKDLDVFTGELEFKVCAELSLNGSESKGYGETRAFKLDKVRPQLSQQPADGTKTFREATKAFLIRISEAVARIDASDFLVTNGSAASVEPGDANSFVLNVRPRFVGDVTVGMNQDTIFDLAGNGNLELASETYDNQFLSAVLTSQSVQNASASNISPVLFSVTFSSPVTGVDTADIELVNGTLTSQGLIAVGSDQTLYQFNVVPTVDGTVTVKVRSGAGVSPTGVQSLESNIFSFTSDRTRPTVSLSSPSPSTATVTFSEPVAGLDASDFVISGGTVSQITGGPSVYQVGLQKSIGAAVIVLNLIDAATTDLVGNPSRPATTDLRISFDASRPTVQIVLGAQSPTRLNRVPVTITFSEAVTGFDNVSDLLVVNGTSSAPTKVAPVAESRNYSVEVTPTAAGVVSFSIPEGVAVDVANNGNSASAVLTFTFDPNSPTVSINGTPSPTAGPISGPATISLTFTEPVQGLELGDFEVVGGVVSNLTGSGTQYTVTFVPSTNGPVSIKLKGATVVDAAGNPNIESARLDYTFDSARPSCVLSSTSAVVVNATNVKVSVTFSEPVTGLALTDFVATNASLSNLVFLSPSSAEFTLSRRADGRATVQLVENAVSDQSGNKGLASAVFEREFDTSRPTVSLTTSKQVVSGSFEVRVLFSENVTNFVLPGDITLAGATLAQNVKVSDREYVLTLSPTAQGNVTVVVPDGVATDRVGLTNTASQSLVVTFDSVPPTVVLTAANFTSFTNLRVVDVLAVFSEAVTGFDASDLTLVRGQVQALTNSSGDRKTYSLRVQAASEGTVSVTVNGNAVKDSADQGNAVSNILSWIYDATRPVPVLSRETTSNAATSQMVRVDFNEPVTGLTSSDFSVINGTLVSFSALSSSSARVEIRPSASGLVRISLPANAAVDRAQNPSNAAGDLNFTVDMVAPTVLVYPQTGHFNFANRLVLQAEFSESVTDLQAQRLVVTNGVLQSSTLTRVNSNLFYFEVDRTENRSVRIHMPSTSASDLAGNAMVAATFNFDYVDVTGQNYLQLPDAAMDAQGNIYIVIQGFNLVSLNSKTDWWVRKFSSSGVEDQTWNKKIDIDVHDYPTSVAVDAAGSIYVAGVSGDAGIYRWRVKKYNAQGVEDMTWNKAIDVPSPRLPYSLRFQNFDLGDLVTDASNNVYMAGSYFDGSTERVLIKKFSANGNEILDGWNKYLPVGMSRVNVLGVDSLGDLYVVGGGNHLFASNSHYDWVIKKYQRTGAEVLSGWNKIIDGGLQADSPDAIAFDGDGNVYIGGTGYALAANNTSYDWWLKKFTRTGAELTAHEKKINRESQDLISALGFDNTGAIYVGGEYRENRGDGYLSQHFGLRKYSSTTGAEITAGWNKFFSIPLGNLPGNRLSRIIVDPRTRDVYMIGHRAVSSPTYRSAPFIRKYTSGGAELYNLLSNWE